MYGRRTLAHDGIELRPRVYAPASYEPVQKKMLDRPATMIDVADFVVDYINSDVSTKYSSRQFMSR